MGERGKYKCLLFIYFQGTDLRASEAHSYSFTSPSISITTSLDLASPDTFSFSLLGSMAESVNFLLFCVIWIGKQIAAPSGHTVPYYLYSVIGNSLPLSSWLFSHSQETDHFRPISLPTLILFHQCVPCSHGHAFANVTLLPCNYFSSLLIQIFTLLLHSA